MEHGIILYSLVVLWAAVGSSSPSSKQDGNRHPAGWFRSDDDGRGSDPHPGTTAFKAYEAAAPAAASSSVSVIERSIRAAEILSTSLNHQAAIVSSSTVTPGNADNGTSPSSSSLIPSMTTMKDPPLYSSTPPSTSDETFNDEDPDPTTDTTVEDQHAVTTATVPISTPLPHSSPGNEEYFADYHGAGVVTDNDDMEETTASTVVVDKSTSVHTSSTTEIQYSTTQSTLTRMEESTGLDVTGSLNATRPALLAAVGRALSQEENVPWPEAKSTKVIGTIIEDIHGPFSDGVSSSTADALNSGTIAAIVLCTFIILLTTIGASGYWWYRRRYLLNRPETLSDRYAPSETGLGAGEDIFRVGYVHSPELPRDSSEEMYSLDNDSFLTSLEAMTIPTYWTETIKHTKL